MVASAPRGHRPLAAGGTFLALPVVLLALCLLPAGPGAAAAAERFDPFSVGIEAKPDAAVPADAVLADETGNPFRLGDAFDGLPVVLAPIYYTCPNICGVTLGGLYQSLDNIPFRAGRDYRVVAISFQPGDTPADAARSKAEALTRTRRPGAAAASHFLTGSEAEIRRVMDGIGFTYAWDPTLGQYAHAAGIAVLMPDGRVARWLSGVAFEPTDLRLALIEAGQGKVGGIADRLLLLCYHYDPVYGRYSSLVVGSLQVGGVLTVLALAALIGLALRQERRSRRHAGPAGGPRPAAGQTPEIEQDSTLQREAR